MTESGGAAQQISLAAFIMLLLVVLYGQNIMDWEDGSRIDTTKIAHPTGSCQILAAQTVYSFENRVGL